METPDSIYFYSQTKDDFGYMSNFYPITFVDENNLLFNCSEQYLMYHKCKLFDPDNTKMLQQILKEKSPAKIKALGRLVNNYNEQIWSNSRYQVMVNGLRLKFSQNQSIANKLIQTHPKMLYEAAKNDSIWGIGFDAETVITKNIDKASFGSNLLGQALVQVRGELIG